ncbi:MAG: sulfite exporter TauE/SafE family protein [Candidatus Zixiibacteriota bacterium]|nr:MAG: sulfite exporter TauE/SafE family protein [candidate division Zixibacteria bacterium]
MSDYLFMLAGGTLAGLLGSILGLGGGILIIPMLTLVFGVPMREAIGASLVCVIATSSGAASLYVRRRLCDVRLGMTLELATTLGAVVGGVIAGLLNAQTLSILFSVLLIYTAWTMLRKREVVESRGASSSGGTSYKVAHLPLGMGASFFAGNVSGLLGVGGGIVKVPVMYTMMGVPLKTALATSNFMIGVTASAGAFVYFSRGEVHPLVAGSTMLGAFLGATLGSRLLPKIRAEYLKKAFVLVLIYLSLEMLFKGLGLRLAF